MEMCCAQVRRDDSRTDETGKSEAHEMRKLSVEHSLGQADVVAADNKIPGNGQVQLFPGIVI